MLRQGCSLAIKPRSSILTKSYGRTLQYSKNLQIVATRPKIQVSRNPSNFQWTVLNVHPKLFEQRRTYASLPAHSELGLPALSPTMEKGNLAKWKKKEGDKISAGDVIAEIETDKATVDFEATDDGYLAKILYEEGTNDLVVGTPIAIVVEDAKDIAAFKDYKAGAAAPKAAPKAESAPEPTPAPKAESAPAAAAPKPAAAPAPSGKVVPGAPPPPVARKGAASPAARATAAEEGINISGIQGSGPNGRIIKADVLDAKSRPATSAAPRAQAIAPAGTDFTDIPNTQIRRVIASRLSLSKQTIPHYYLTMECRVDKLLELRTKLNDSANGKFKLSVNDFIVKASALALKKVPEANSSWTEESIRRFHTVDINVAVATDKGLLTPLIPNADRIGLAAINQSVKQLADKGKEGKLSPAELTTGTFTISNLGMFGIKQFAAVINPPQACILAVGTTEKRLLPAEGAAAASGNNYAVGQFLTVTLSCDHRVVDGAVGAQWLQAFKEYIEDPTKMLL